MTNPFVDLPPQNFWRTGVASLSPFAIDNLVSAKFRIDPQDKIITLGSCFAQRLSQALVARGYAWLDAEPAPPMLSKASCQALNYGIFSFRTGNIYTAALLRQWIDWALDGPPEDLEMAISDGRYQDMFRPEIEPNGFANADELEQTRARTCDAIREAFTTADVFVFTLGLTEAWRNKKTNHIYPSCPGTIVGQFDPENHVRVNFDYPTVHADLTHVIDRLQQINPNLKVLLTVSPVPLTATATPGGHALVENTYTKSLLRTVAGHIAQTRDGVDYFPGYELIATPPFRGMFYGPNMRTVDPAGVDFVMDHFMRLFGAKSEPGMTFSSRPAVDTQDDVDLICHDYILDYYNAAE